MNTISTPTSNLHGQQLDWAVALALGQTPILSPLYAGGKVAACRVHIGERDTTFGGFINFEPSSDWERAGPILEKVGINLRPCYNGGIRNTGYDAWKADIDFINASLTLHKHTEFGRTALEAAMRCYVRSVLGDTVYIPVELL